MIKELPTLELPSLQESLDKAKYAEWASMQEKTKVDLENCIEQLNTLHDTNTVPEVGEQALPFSLLNDKMECFDLYQAIKKQPLIISWFRGGWCVYDKVDLKYKEEHYHLIEESGAKLIEISSEMPDYLYDTLAFINSRFTILSDFHNDIAREWGLTFKMSKRWLEIYSGYNLDKVNGYDVMELPVPATFIIDQTGKIVYRHFDYDFRKRPELSELIEVLHSLY